MRYLRIILILLLALNFSSFVSPTNNIEDDLLGTWVFSKYENGFSQYEKKTFLDRNLPGLKFKKNGILVKRQNGGWCGTPPISYQNYNGIWKMTSDSTLTISSEYWGGTMEQDFLISDLSNKILKVKTLNSRTEQNK